MKDLLLCVHVVVKTLNLEFSRCHLLAYVKVPVLNCVPHVQHDYIPHSTNQIFFFWRRRCRCRHPCLCSLLRIDTVYNCHLRMRSFRITSRFKGIMKSNLDPRALPFCAWLKERRALGNPEACVFLIGLREEQRTRT